MLRAAYAAPACRLGSLHNTNSARSLLCLVYACALCAQGIAMFASLSGVLFRLNHIIRGQVALKADRQRRQLLLAGATAASQVPLVLLLMRRQDVLGNLVLRGTNPPTQVRRRGGRRAGVVWCAVGCGLWAVQGSYAADLPVLLASAAPTACEPASRGP